MRGARVFERNTYWILGTMSLAMALWLAIPELVSTDLVSGTGTWVAWVGGATPETLSGEPYRLLSALTAHLGLFHLLVNLVLLWIAGLALARLSTAWMVPTTFLLSGALGTAATLDFTEGMLWGPRQGFSGFGALMWLGFLPDPARTRQVRLVVTALVLAIGGGW